MDSSGSGALVGFCEDGNESSDSLKDGQFLD
jgi:hypothetical protein